MSVNGIRFDEWGGVDQHAARMMARDPEARPLRVRVMFAAIGWSNLIGHAEFAAGGLALVLQSSDPRTGEISIPGRGQVNKAIREAEDAGYVGAGSSRHCLRAPDWWDKAGGKGGKTCIFHGIRSRRTGTTIAPPQPRTGATSAPHRRNHCAAPTR
jgi:hypothetical protein